ncbi:hypothetical protein GLYMA_15G148350v4 [Glycine max]|nr:hypothetical protein GLYMA_15G148350v4 [Glycine max]KAH1147220.1 hypothetical protein GYH30_042406 [Glycine max]
MKFGRGEEERIVLYKLQLLLGPTNQHSPPDLSLAVENVSSLANTVHFLNLSCNNLNGRFFTISTIGLFHNLQVLDLSDNFITGQLPSFGSVPEELLQTSMPLEELDLSFNGFTSNCWRIDPFLSLSSFVGAELPLYKALVMGN